MKRKYKYIQDPGHGWLSVPKKDVEMLGIGNQITKFSYMKGNRVYLEEDRDASVFLAEAQNYGIDYEITESHSNRPSWIRYQEKYRR